MSEQGLSGENSPAAAGPAGAADENSQPEVDWQKRFVDTQEAYTRGQQERADLQRQNELKDVLLFAEDPDSAARPRTRRTARRRPSRRAHDTTTRTSSCRPA